MSDNIVNLFEKVRDIPYHCDVTRNPQNLFKKNRGSCFEKNVYLGNRLEDIGYDVKYMKAEFEWDKLPISDSTLSLLDDKDSEHLFLEVKMEDRWISIDSTFDSELEKAGFRVETDWDGKSDTIIAVPPDEISEWRDIPKIIEVDDKLEFFTQLNRELEKKR